MAIRRYGVFSGMVLDRRAEEGERSRHYEILLEGGGERFRIAVNTRSGTSHHRDADLLYFADEDFRHPLTRRLGAAADGFTPIASEPGALALDYQRGGLFDRRHMRRIPSRLPGPRNDLVDELDAFMARALGNPASRLHAYGSRWGPEPESPDLVFGFLPGNGIHDVHMNQGNSDEHWHDNGIWSDGGLLFRNRGRDRWEAIFLAFQTQSWHTNDEGDPVPYPPRDGRSHDERERGESPRARIVGAFVHPDDEKRGAEHVAIRNDGGDPLDVSGWHVLNGEGDAARLSGPLPPRGVRRFDLPADVPLSAQGGRIRLLDAAGAEIDAVSYTRREARRKHGALTF